MVNSDWYRRDYRAGIVPKIQRGLLYLNLVQNQLLRAKVYLRDCLHEFDETQGEFINKSEEEINIMLDIIDEKDLAGIDAQLEELVDQGQI